MLHKSTFIFANLTAAAILATIVQYVNAAVVTSLKPLAFITSAIADGVTDTQVLLPNGASEHDYFLRPSDIRRIKNADLVVWIGPEMEAFMAKSVKTLNAKKQVTIAELNEVSHHLAEKKDGISLSRRENKEYNMHLWLSPEIAQISAIAIHNKLVELIPQSRAKLDENLKDFQLQLAAIDKQVGDELAPLKGIGYFVFHDAYSYYEKHYGLKPLGYFTFNPEIRPSAQRLHEIRTQLVAQKATCVFAEPQFRPVILDAVVRGTSIRIGILDPLGTNIQLSKQSYATFISQLANQYASCLKGE